MGPTYIPDLLIEYKPNGALRSLGRCQLAELQVRTKQDEAADATRRWNQLPEHVKCSPTTDNFKFKLKTLLLSFSFEWLSILLHLLNLFLHFYSNYLNLSPFHCF